MILMVQLNISLIINKILETTRDERVIELISFIYVITKNEEKYNLVEQRDFDEIERMSGEVKPIEIYTLKRIKKVNSKALNSEYNNNSAFNSSSINIDNLIPILAEPRNPSIPATKTMTKGESQGGIAIPASNFRVNSAIP